MPAYSAKALLDHLLSEQVITQRVYDKIKLNKYVFKIKKDDFFPEEKYPIVKKPKNIEEQFDMMIMDIGSEMAKSTLTESFNDFRKQKVLTFLEEFQKCISDQIHLARLLYLIKHHKFNKIINDPIIFKLAVENINDPIIKEKYAGLKERSFATDELRDDLLIRFKFHFGLYNDETSKKIAKYYKRRDISIKDVAENFRFMVETKIEQQQDKHNNLDKNLKYLVIPFFDAERELMDSEKQLSDYLADKSLELSHLNKHILEGFNTAAQILIDQFSLGNNNAEYNFIKQQINLLAQISLIIGQIERNYENYKKISHDTISDRKSNFLNELHISYSNILKNPHKTLDEKLYNIEDLLRNSAAITPKSFLQSLGKMSPLATLILKARTAIIDMHYNHPPQMNQHFDLLVTRKKR